MMALLECSSERADDDSSLSLRWLSPCLVRFFVSVCVNLSDFRQLAPQISLYDVYGHVGMPDKLVNRVN